MSDIPGTPGTATLPSVGEILLPVEGTHVYFGNFSIVWPTEVWEIDGQLSEVTCPGDSVWINGCNGEAIELSISEGKIVGKVHRIASDSPEPGCGWTPVEGMIY